MPMIPRNTICTEAGCGSKAYARQLCGKHYQIYRLNLQQSGGWNSVKRGFRDFCSVDDCGKKHFADGLCQLHYYRRIKERNRAFILARYFPNGVVCGRCKKTYDLVQMDAHHLEPNKKEHILSMLLNNSALQRRTELLAELDSCEFMCARCHQNLHHDITKSYEAMYSRKDKGRRVDEMKRVIRQLFGEKCQSCGDWLAPKEMEFHHRNPKEKTGNVSDLALIASRDIVMEEVAKCDILCRNCHRLKLELAA